MLVLAGWDGIQTSVDQGRSWNTYQLNQPSNQPGNYYEYDVSYLPIPDRGGVLISKESGDCLYTLDCGQTWVTLRRIFSSSSPYIQLIQSAVLTPRGHLLLGTRWGMFRSRKPFLEAIPTLDFEIGQPYPHPVLYDCAVPLTFAEPGWATLTIEDITGRRVATLAERYYHRGENIAYFKLDAPGGVYRLVLTVNGISTARTFLKRRVFAHLPSWWPWKD